MNLSLLDFLFPKRCVGCEKTGTYFCPRCILSSKVHFPQVCPVCERNSSDGLTHIRCVRKDLPDGLTAIWAYEGAPRKLISKIKYKFVREMALSLSSSGAGMLKIMERSTPQSPFWKRDKFTLVPIPLHWSRKNWRGFNHTEEIGKILARLMGWRVRVLLVRKRPTQPQVGLKEKQRRKNVQDAFAMKRHSSIAVLPNSVLLFDDVWTTGATMLEVAKVLKKAGVKKVWCLTLAR